MKDTHKSYLFASLTIIFWSTVATAFKVALGNASIPQLLFVASVTSLVTLGGFLIAGGAKRLLMQSKADLLRSAILGFLNPFAYYLILFKAYSLLPAQVAQPINQIWPLVLALLAVPILKQKLPRTTLTSLVICFAGVALISSQGDVNIFGKSSPLGVGLALLSSVVWSVYWLTNVKDERDNVVKLFTNFAFSVLYMLLLSPFVDGFYSFTIEGVASSAYVGLFEMGLSFFCWMSALKYAKSAAKLGLFIYMVPFISLIFIHYVAGEAIRSTTFIGLSIIVAGILYQQKDLLLKKEGRSVE